MPNACRLTLLTTSDKHVLQYTCICSEEKGLVSENTCNIPLRLFKPLKFQCAFIILGLELPAIKP